VQKSVNKPLQYEATPLDNGLMILLQRQKERVGKLEHKKKWIIDNLQIKHNRVCPSEEDHQLIVISEITIWFNLYRKIIERTKETIAVLLPVIGVPSRLHLLWRDVKEDLTVKQPLMIRLITQFPRGSNQPPQSILDHGIFKTRYLEDSISFGMHVYDKREFTMSISPNSGLPSLWSNNPNMVTMAQNNFECLWNKAKE
jgi:hypothetical protein